MQLRGIQFGDYHTADDWELILHEKTVSPPKPKTNYVSVPGRDGDLDLTEALSGIVNYENRTAHYVFLLTNGSQLDRAELIAEIIGVLNGQSMQIIDTDDYPDYYMIGRITVTAFTNINAYGTITIEANCLPWRYAINNMSKSVTVTSSSGTVSVVMSNNGYRTVTPTVVVTGTVTLTYGTTTQSLSAGTYQFPGFQLAPGVTTVSVSGSGSITFTYQEAIF